MEISIIATTMQSKRMEIILIKKKLKKLNKMRNIYRPRVVTLVDSWIIFNLCVHSIDIYVLLHLHKI